MSPHPLPGALPAPRRPTADSVPSLRWGVLGTGWIASRFVASLQSSTTQRVVAVGSRTQASADAFATAHSIERAVRRATALVADPGVDTVYVATPHHLHRESALLAIEAGKHVLVEKPLGLNAIEAQEISDAAAAAGVFCMEAMWSLFLPRFDVVRQVLDLGMLGDVRTVLADHGEHFDAPHRILDPAMAGGSLLDLGTYVTTFATWVLGPASRVQASGSMTPRGVNGQAAMVLTHAGEATSVLHSTLLTRTPTAATIAGTAATLTLPGPFFQPGDVAVTSADGSRTLTWTEPEPIGHGALFHSALEAARCIGEGLLESPLHPARAVVRNMTALDEVTRQVGVTYAPTR
ncbi:Gfo/Idh/MocA family protein [Humibacillus xanthopallidus]|uniref:Putative dehydrogenase n=1 Tax=Humibacillus xanthopallidus TaxID=412689 RepID=A0A543I318_9MICO|nr:Gfo/Idh/MocA family oxidoreductase [Humibacillus xanthopallidus]TQM64870.1 putative dehydrogenase [Humibacillus xanthopallidus]